jgi:hypothetical protein
MSHDTTAIGGLRRGVLLAILTLLVAWPAAAQFTITLVSSDWSLSAGETDLALPRPGSDFQDSFRQWAASDARISVTASNAARWYVTAHLRVPAGQEWPPGLAVYVIRTGDGTGSGGGAEIVGSLNSPLGPLPTEPLGATPAFPLFNGKRTRSNVPLTLRIEQLSAAIPAGSYQVEVVYTVQ